MSRFLVAYLMAGAQLVAPSATAPVDADPVSVPGPPCPVLSLEETFLCVKLIFTVGGANLHEFVVIEWGDGTSDFVDCVRGGSPCTGTAAHTYAAEGSYAIKVTAQTGCPGSVNWIAAIVDASPEFALDAGSSGDDWIQPATSEALETGKLRRSTVDWGDGTPLEEFEWTSCGEGLLCMPQHQYASPGEYTVVARIEYLSAWEGTCYERVATLQASVPTPVETTTWGAVKALYR